MGRLAVTQALIQGDNPENNMRTLFRTGFLLALVASGLVHAGGTPSSTRQQIQAAWDRMKVAANAHDTDRFMASYLQQPRLVFVVNGEVFHGWDDLHAQQLKWWQNGKANAVYAERGATQFMPLGADLMVTTSQLTSHRTLADGKTSDGSFVITSIWKRLPQGWRIVYGHESWVR